MGDSESPSRPPHIPASAGMGLASSASASPGPELPATARLSCLRCRASKHKCDREVPCSRCKAARKTCEYPPWTNRGRKPGSANKRKTPVPETEAGAERSSDKQPRLAHSFLEEDPTASASRASTSQLDLLHAPESSTALDAVFDFGAFYNPSPTTSRNQIVSSLRPHEADDEGLLTPLQHLTTALSQVPEPEEDFPSINSLRRRFLTGAGSKGPRPDGHFGREVARKVTRYFGRVTAENSDWEVLARQTPESPFRLDERFCEPLGARLLSSEQVDACFTDFFRLRTPYVTLLDPELHTPATVRASSFTLFSVVCSLGASISASTSTRLLFPALNAITDRNIRWCISSGVVSLETVQALILASFWQEIAPEINNAPWVIRNGAVRLVQELGINQRARIEALVQVKLAGKDGNRERHIRNYERARYIASFLDGVCAMTIGGPNDRSDPNSALVTIDDEWWMSPLATLGDRVTAGHLELHKTMSEGLAQYRTIPRDDQIISAIERWSAEMLTRLETLRHVRCRYDGQTSSIYLSVLALHVDHACLVILDRAITRIQTLGGTCDLSLQDSVARCACRLLDLFVGDLRMLNIVWGLSDLLWLMSSHAAVQLYKMLQIAELSENWAERFQRLIATKQFLIELRTASPESILISSSVELLVELVHQAEGSQWHPNPRPAARTSDPGNRLAFPPPPQTTGSASSETMSFDFGDLVQGIIPMEDRHEL